MKKKGLFFSKDFERCIDFHGHICPGIAIGFRAAKAGLEWLEENRALDEEIVSIVETDACGVDAVQVLTGCTFGKGNLIFKDYGKQVFTFLSRETDLGVRVALKPDCIPSSERHGQLMKKISAGEASKREHEEFKNLHREKAVMILEKRLEDLFSISIAEMKMPDKARIDSSKPCAICGEPTMQSKLIKNGSKLVCMDCLTQLNQ